MILVVRAGAKGSSSTITPICIGKVGLRVLYSTGAAPAAGPSSPEDDFVVVETPDSIASQARCSLSVCIRNLQIVQLCCLALEGAVLQLACRLLF